MIELPSDALWAIGLVLIVGAITIFWNMNLTSNARREPVSDLPNPEPVTKAGALRRYKGMPVLAPAPPTVQEEQDPPEAAAHVDSSPQGGTTKSVDEAYVMIPDSEDADVLLELAWKSEVTGDFEGRDEYAKLVLARSDVSSRQKDRAEAILLRASSV